MKTKVLQALLLIAVLALYRVLPHPPNVTPLAAIAFLAGVSGGRRVGLLVTLGALFLSDVALNLLLTGSAFYAARLVDYAAFLAIAAGAGCLLGRPLAARVAGAVLTPFVFFLISNFGVWIAGVLGGPALYPMTAPGLLACYVAGLPFLVNSALGDWFFMIALVAVFQCSAGRSTSPVFARS